MKISNFIIVLAVILIIAAGSLWYTSKDNDRLSDIEATAELDSDLNFDGVEYVEESKDTVPQDIDSDLRVIEFNNSYEHTKPGEYSEIIVDATGFKPGQFTIMYVRDAKTKEWIAAGGQEITADENGRMQARFMITQYGNYEVYLNNNGEEVVSPVITVE